MFIVLQTGTQDFNNVLRGVERFVRHEIRLGMRVSIGGLPFTVDREQMLLTLDAMRGKPFGQRPDEDGRWLPPTIDITEQSVRSMESERETAADPRTEPRRAQRPNARLTTDFDQQIDGYYQVVLQSYVDLIRELRALPGKKAVVPVPRRIASRHQQPRPDEPHRRRVRAESSQFLHRGFTRCAAAASRGGRFHERRHRRLKSPTGGGRRETLAEERQGRFSQSQQGLHQLAAMTGGRALLNSNDQSLVFRQLAEDAGGYYLVSYSPTRTPDDTDQRRNIEVRVAGAKRTVRYPKVYYDQRRTTP